jgi:hypothetical protein
MLGSITPLGERGRGSRWWLTTTIYFVGSSVAGFALGAALGVLGSALFGSVATAPRLALLGVGVLVGLMLDLGAFGLRLPTVHRQVDEAWRTRYRGWVWGLGFGLQLGLGIVTIATTSTIYATWLASALAGGIRWGAAIGLVFGAARALPVFGVARVRRTEQLLRVDAVLARLAVPARRAAIAGGGVAAAVALAGSVRW